MPQPQHRNKEIIESYLRMLETPRKPLSKWEENFLASLAEQVQAQGSLSERQFEILDRIYT